MDQKAQGRVPTVVQWVKGSGFASAVLQVTAMAWSQSLARELPYAMGVAIKKKKKKSRGLKLQYNTYEGGQEPNAQNVLDEYVSEYMLGNS